MQVFLSKKLYKRQVYFRPFKTSYGNKRILNGQSNITNFSMKLKNALAKKIQILPQTQINCFMQCATHLTMELAQQFYNFIKKLNKMNLISANSRLTELRIKLSYDSLQYERVYSTAIFNKLTGYEFLLLGSKHHKPIIFLFTQNSNPNHRVHIFKFYKILQLPITLDGR